MKGTEHFKDVIQNYLETRASYDELFSENFHKENKNIDECITYILTEVQRMGCAGLSDEEVYSLAVHYYDEDNIEVGKSINCQVVVNHTIELTEEEKAEARIYVGTYAKYSNGSLQGEWVELSDFYDLDDFMERCAEIHEDEEEPEYMFQAWEEIPMV